MEMHKTSKRRFQITFNACCRDIGAFLESVSREGRFILLGVSAV